MNMEELEKKYYDFKDDMTRRIRTEEGRIAAELQRYVNARVSKFCQINKVVLQPVPPENSL